MVSGTELIGAYQGLKSAFDVLQGLNAASKEAAINQVKVDLTRHILEAQQIAMDEHPAHQLYNLNIDAGSMWARRLIDAMVAWEKPATPVIPIRRAA